MRVGAFMAELLEPEVMLVVLGRAPPETLTVAKHIVMMHSRPVLESR